MNQRQINERQILEAERVLVFAPHNDDEILGTGGVIQRYLKSGSEVTVAIMTNGDGQIRRPSFIPFFKPDFVKLGYRRQEESLDSLESLGVNEENVQFFGYPDRGLSKMWTNFWEEDNLYYSKYTKKHHSPYDNSFRKNAPYCGSAVVQDVRNLILEVEPDAVYFPHPNDTHPDHWATNGFVLYGIESLKNGGVEWLQELETLTYLVHSIRFPYPRGKFLEAALKQPSELEELDTQWVSVPLDFKERVQKLRAIGKHRTQTQLMRKYLNSFARANELFGVVPSLSLNGKADYEPTPNLSKDFVLNEQEDEPLLSYLNPKRRSRIASLKRYPDMKSVNLKRNQELLRLAIDFYNKYRPGNEIQISLKPFTKDHCPGNVQRSHSFRFRKGKLFHNGKATGSREKISYETGPKSYSLSVPLNKINYPDKLILSITLARKGKPFARSANRLIKFC